MNFSDKAKEIFTKVKAAFDVPAIPAAPVAPIAPLAPVAPVALMATTYKLVDGTEVSVTQAGEEIGVGDAVTVAGAPAPEGVHELEGGMKITVDATGCVTMIDEAPETTVDPAAPAMPAAPATPDYSAMEARILALETELAKLRQPTTQMEDVQVTMNKQGETIKGIFELISELVKSPTVAPVTISDAKKQKFNAERQKAENKFTAIADAMIKKNR